jgi:hypothetical protein
MINPTKDISKFSKDELQLRVLDESWNERLLEITRQAPVTTTRLQIHFDRSPNLFLIPKLTSYKWRCLGLFEGDLLVGYTMATYQQRYVQGRAENVIYLGNMHVIHRGLGKIFLRLLAERYQRIIPKGTGVSFFYAYILENNKPAQGLSKKGYLGSHMLGHIRMHMILLSHPLRKSHDFTFRWAAPRDSEAIVDLLDNHHRKRSLSPVVTHESIQKQIIERPDFTIQNYLLAEANGEVLGVLGTWDMTAFKKNWVLDYDRGLAVWRSMYNIQAPLWGSAKLPGKGELIRDITISEYATHEDNPDILEALLRYAYCHFKAQDYHFIILGTGSGDPMEKALHPFWLKKTLQSQVVAGSIQTETFRSWSAEEVLYADAVQI